MIRLLVGMCRAEIETLVVAHEFSFLLEGQKVLKLFAQYLYTNCLFRLNFAELLELDKYGRCSDYYRLSCLRHILLLMHCFA